MCLTFGEGGGALGKVRHVSLFARFFILDGPLGPRAFFYFFLEKIKKKLKKTGNSIRSGPNLRSFSFYRGGRV